MDLGKAAIEWGEQRMVSYRAMLQMLQMSCDAAVRSVGREVSLPVFDLLKHPRRP